MNEGQEKNWKFSWICNTFSIPLDLLVTSIFFLTCSALFKFTTLFIYYSEFCSFLIVSPAPRYQPVFSEFDNSFLLISPAIWNSLFLVIWYDLMPFFQLQKHYNFSGRKFFIGNLSLLSVDSVFQCAWEASQAYISPRQESENCWIQPHSSDLLKFKIGFLFRQPWKRVGPH